MTSINLKFLNVRYSPNLGDGLLVDCLEWGCRQQLPNASIASIDLAGRTAYPRGPGLRETVLTALEAMPSGLRRAAAGAALRARVRFRLLEFYREHLRGADAVVVGGGNLFSDMDLNFPTKLDAALSVVAETGSPVWIYGCGVSESWSKEGCALFKRAVSRANLINVYVRDEGSKRSWDERLGQATGLEAVVVRDPGLLASQTYGNLLSATQEPRRVGVGIIAPIAISYHGGPKAELNSLSEWFEQLIEGLVASGRAVTLVSNGSPEDTRFGVALLEKLRSKLPEAMVDLPVHRTPTDLVRTFSKLSAFVGFRLHGLICACSVGIPTFALDWDRKVGAFMKSIGRGNCYFNTTTDTASTVLAHVLRGPPGAESELAMRESLSGIAELCSSIARTVERGS